MIKNIIFDIGNVLADFRWRDLLKDLGFEDAVQKRVAECTVLSKHWNEMDRGTVLFNEILDACISRDPMLEAEIRKFFHAFADMVVEFEYAGDLVKMLKKAGYSVYALSNYSAEAFQHVKDRFRFLQWLDGRILSYEWKAVKPEPQIYKALLDTYQLVPEECIFLDDISDNLRAARAFGIQTIQFCGAAKALAAMKTSGVDFGFDSIIFDLDGTIWDATEQAGRVWTEEAGKLGISQMITGNDLKKLYGKPLEEIAYGLFPDVEKETALKVMERSVIAQCPVLEEKGGFLFEGIEEVIKTLSEKYRLYIVSNCKAGYIEAFLAHYQWECYFRDYECPGRTGKLKAENIRLVIERNGLKNPVYIGDTTGDKKAAGEAGLFFIHAGYGFEGFDRNAVSVQHPSELLQILQ